MNGTVTKKPSVESMTEHEQRGRVMSNRGLVGRLKAFLKGWTQCFM